MNVITILLLALSSVGVYAQIAPDNPLSQLKMAHYEESKSSITAVEHPVKPNIDKHILVLFFSNQCPHCITFAPILKHFVEENHWNIEAISLNGQTLPEFPHALFATQDMIDVAYQGKPVVYPALFIANTQSKSLYPISFGEMSYPELQERIKIVKEKMAEYEERHP